MSWLIFLLNEVAQARKKLSIDHCPAQTLRAKRRIVVLFHSSTFCPTASEKMHLKNGISKETKEARERAKNRQTSDVEHGGLTFIEQLAVFASCECEAYGTPFFFRRDEDEEKIEFARGSCGMWSCESCGAKNAKKWIARVIDGCNKLPPENWYFATITAHRKWRGHSSLINLRKNWEKLKKRMKRLTRKHGEELYYVRVWEAHKDGSFHMHVIANAPINTRWLKDNAAKCGLGYQAKYDKVVNAGQVAGYISKYMLKSMPNATHYPKGARRIEVSNNWVAWHEKEDSEWKLVFRFEEAKCMATRYQKHGWAVHDLALRNEDKRLAKRDEEARERMSKEENKS